MVDVWKRPEIDSPCVNICVIHRQSGLCMGCFRTGDEIAGWSRMTPESRRALMDELPARAPKIKGQRRGRRKATE